MTLEQILDGGYAVASDDWMNMIVVWNGHDIFNVWSEVEENTYRNVDFFTQYNIITPRMAKEVGRKWIQNVYDQMEGYYEAA